MDKDIKADLLQEASDLVTGPRAKDYGDATINHMRIADMWNVWLNNRSWAHHGVVTPYDVSMMMSLVKFARCQQQPNHDSHVDIAGYSAVSEDIYEKIMEVENDRESGPSTQNTGAK